MKKIGILIFCLVVLIGGGMLTAIVPRGAAPEDMPGALVQTLDPEASVFRTTEWQTQQLVWLIIAIVVSLIGFAIPLALLMWFLNWGRTTSLHDTSAASTETAIEKTE